MKDSVKIKIDAISSANLFLKIVTTFDSDIDAISGRHILDAKSALGIFTLDLSKPIEVKILSSDEEEISRFNSEMKQFEVE